MREAPLRRESIRLRQVQNAVKIPHCAGGEQPQAVQRKKHEMEAMGVTGRLFYRYQYFLWRGACLNANLEDG